MLEIYVIKQWMGNSWAINGKAFLSEDKAHEYCKPDHFRYETVKVEDSEGLVLYCVV